MYKFILSFVLFYFYLMMLGNAQELSKHKEYEVINAVLKNLTLGQAAFNIDRHCTIGKGFIIDSPNINNLLSFPGFGYQPFLPQYIFTPVNDISVLGYQLFVLHFDRTHQENISLYRWGSYQDEALRNQKSDIRYLFAQTPILVGVSEQHKEIVFISSTYYRHPIAKYFNLNAEQPVSYLPFLRCKLFYRQFDDIAFEKIRNDSLYFIGDKKVGDVVLQDRYVLAVEQPDTSLKRIGPVDPSVVNTDRSLVPKVFPDKQALPEFRNKHSKQNYILNALMKNIYLYRLSTVPDIKEKLNLDGIAGINVSLLDSLLPNFDEHFLNMGVLEYSSTWASQADTFFSKSYRYNYRPVNEGNTIYAYRKALEEIEFYKIYKSEFDVLTRKSSHYTRLSLGKWDIPYANWYRYDHYWDTTAMAQSSISPPLPPIIDYFKSGMWTAPQTRRPEDVIEAYPSQYDYYLVALNVKTREVHFVSGPDIFLSPCVAFYYWNNEGLEFKDWNLKHQLFYIQDRLYPYQIPQPLTDEYITYYDEQSIQLKIPGKIRGKPIQLSVEVNLLEPENIQVTIE